MNFGIVIDRRGWKRWFWSVTRDDGTLLHLGWTYTHRGAKRAVQQTIMQAEEVLS